jgi:cell division protein FtsB
MNWILSKIKSYATWGWVAISTIVGGFLFLRNNQLEHDKEDLQAENNYLHLKNKTIKSQTKIDDNLLKAKDIYKLEPQENPNEIIVVDA